VPPLVVLARARRSRSLAEEPPDAPPDAPAVAVVIPARDEARNIERCVRSVLASRYPALEVVVVDDRSTDGTGDIARAIAAGDPRLRVIESRPLPPGWFGKQWACAQGAAATRPELLCFTDADTVHAPDLLPRAVNTLIARDAELLSVAGTQEVETFWERVIQPQVFSLLLARFGGTEVVNRSRRASDRIANGQFLLFRRAAYESAGGHEAVRGHVAEDLALAQLHWRAGHRTALVLGLDHLHTRMYTTLGELVRGWMKNIYAGALDAAPGGRAGRLALPIMLLLPHAMMLAPPLVLLASALGLASAAAAQWALVCTVVLLAWWVVVYRGVLRLSPLWALAFPLGSAVLAWITLRAVARGRRVRWKGREYVSHSLP
jgi:chlorobactene glucosyltransferase